METYRLDFLEEGMVEASRLGWYTSIEASLILCAMLGARSGTPAAIRTDLLKMKIRECKWFSIEREGEIFGSLSVERTH